MSIAIWRSKGAKFLFFCFIYRIFPLVIVRRTYHRYVLLVFLHTEHLDGTDLAEYLSRNASNGDLVSQSW